MSRLTHEELARLKGEKNWAVLWQHAIPLVKMTVGRMARGKTQKGSATEDVLQEGMVAAGIAMQSWDPLECAYSTHIANKVRWHLLGYIGGERNHRIGSHERQPVVMNLGDSRDGMFGFGSDECAEEDEDDGTFDAALTYAGVLRPSGQFDGLGMFNGPGAPEGFGDPSIEAERLQTEAGMRAVVESLRDPYEREVVRCVLGLGCQAEPIEQFAGRYNVTRSTAHRWLRVAMNKLRTKLPQSTHIKYGSKENVRDTQQR